MKILHHVLLCMVIAMLIQSVARSQISITDADVQNFFGVGKSWVDYQNSDSTEMMDVGVSSSTTSQVWTPPNVYFSAKDSSRSDNILPASTPYASNFPSAMYAQKINILQSGFTTVVYQYFKLSNDSLYTVGYAQHAYGTVAGHVIDTVIMSTTPKFSVHFPIHIGDLISQTVDTTALGVGLFDVVTTTDKYDAYGTLNLPNGSFQALRENITVLHQYYINGVLSSQFYMPAFTWITGEGHQLHVEADSGAVSGVLKIKTLALLYIAATPASSVKTLPNVPLSATLEQNYPNPFNPSTTINFQIANSEFVSLKVFDILGREVTSLLNEQKSPGTYSVQFDAKNLPSGVYVYQLRTGSSLETKKMLLLK